MKKLSILPEVLSKYQNEDLNVTQKTLFFLHYAVVGREYGIFKMEG